MLLNSFNRGRLASTYLFYGADGVGKWPMAIALAALLNCEKPRLGPDGSVIDACGECRNCRQTENLIFPELHFALPLPPHKKEAEAIDLTREYLDQKKAEPYRIISSSRQLTIPIDIAREIKRKTGIRLDKGVKRVILFYQMEKMLPASADSLLKLIEEPPPGTTIILTANDPDNLLPTLQSRAQKILFRSIPAAEIVRYLAEKHSLPIEKGTFAARLAEGSLGRALEFIGEEGEMPRRQTSFLMFKSIFLKDNPSAAATVNELANPKDRGETEQTLLYWQSFLSDIILLKYGGNRSDLINVDLGAELENLTSLVAAPDDFSEILNNVKQVGLALRRNAHIRPALISLVFKLKKHINQTP